MDSNSDNDYVSTLQYRAVWIAADGHTVKGNLTDLEDATHQVKFMTKYRNVWLEDENGNKVDYEHPE